MTLRAEWTAIAARIDGFLTSTSVYLQTLVESRDDPLSGASDVLLQEARRIFVELQTFATRHGSLLKSPLK